MELSNVSGVVNTTDTLVFVCGKQSSIFNIIFSNITGLASNVDIKIFNKKLNRELNLPKGEEFLIYLAKGLSVQPNNILKFGGSDDNNYYLNEGDKIYVSSLSTNTLHYHVNVKSNM